MLVQASLTAPIPAVQYDNTKLSVDLFGALINLSGRRRFTSQRVVLYAVLASMGHDGAIETARETLALLRQAHHSLVHGKGKLPGIFCAQLHDAYYGTLQGDRVISDFIHLAGWTLDAIGDDARGAPALLDELVRSATPLLSVLNGLTLVYEEQAMRHAQAEKRRIRETMGQMKTVARHARKIALHAQIVAARAGAGGQEFSVAASSMAGVTAEIDDLIESALATAFP